MEKSDDVARTRVEADLSDDIPNLARLRRYQRSLQRQMGYNIDHFYVEHPDRWDDLNRKPAFIAQVCIDRERERNQTWSFAEPALVLKQNKANGYRAGDLDRRSARNEAIRRRGSARR